MCIRDRRVIEPFRRGGVAGRRGGGAGEKVLGVGWVDGDRPVSYTHLRAHETVLDLVCRLLLEKKK